MAASPSCVACGRPGPRASARGILRCAGCGHGQLAAMPDDAESRRVAALVSREGARFERIDDLFTASGPAHSFEGVVVEDVIEQVPRPGDALDRIAELLAPDGVLTLKLPRSWSATPTRMHHFTRLSVAMLVERHGFTVLEGATEPRAVGVARRLLGPHVRDRMVVAARGPWPGE